MRRWRRGHDASFAGTIEAEDGLLDDLPNLRPTVQVIDDWNTNRRLGMVFECRTAKGRLMVCSADLEEHLDQRPAARQLLSSPLDYVQSGSIRI